MLESVQIPMTSREIYDAIGNLVLRANELQNDAWHIEREAIEGLEDLIEGVAQHSPQPI
jgi:hypothetical protein